MRARTIWEGLMLPPWRFLASRWPWAALLFALSSALIAVLLVALIVPTLLLLPLWGILLAVVDRRRLRLLGGQRVPSGHVQVPRAERRNWLNIRLTEPATWRETLSLLANLLLGAVSLTVLFFEGLFLAVLIVIPGMVSRREVDINVFGDLRVVLGPDDWWQTVLAGLVTLPVAAYVNALLAALHGRCIRWLIAPRTAEIDERVAGLTRSRAAIVDAHEHERRRIERDLHDGVQQELVAIAARLGLLELELAGGDRAASETALAAAQTQTERALQALRETVRGIHPAVLSDRGLAAALEDLAGRSAMPLLIEDRGFPRLSPAAEAAAYFFVAEAVTNAAKHTAASHLEVVLGADERSATVLARDRGHGGVDLARGSGLRGLSERADALGGRLTVDSPAGGPTVLLLELPMQRAGADPQVATTGEEHRAHSAR